MSTLLRLAYDGTEFHGYARQRASSGHPEVRTVQAVVEDALSRLFKTEILTRAASRTDAGVHARGQLLAFDPPFSIPAQGLLLGLAAQLPKDVSAFAAWDEPGCVDTRSGNQGKHYRYRIRCTRSRDPTARNYEWHLGRRLDVHGMRDGAARLVGTHDFASFRAADCQSRTTERTLTAIEITGQPNRLGPAADVGRLDDAAPEAATRGPDRVDIDVRGTAFLKNMVRILAGTLVEIGLGRREPRSIDELLATPDRSRAGVTAPAQGLTLIEVVWPGRRG